MLFYLTISYSGKNISTPLRLPFDSAQGRHLNVTSVSTSKRVTSLQVKVKNNF